MSQVLDAVLWKGMELFPQMTSYLMAASGGEATTEGSSIDIEWVTQTPEDGGIFSGLIASIKSVIQSANGLVVVIAVGVAMIAVGIIGIMMFMGSRTRETAKGNAIWVAIGLIAVGGAATIVGACLKIGANLQQ